MTWDEGIDDYDRAAALGQWGMYPDGSFDPDEPLDRYGRKRLSIAVPAEMYLIGFQYRVQVVNHLPGELGYALTFYIRGLRRRETRQSSFKCIEVVLGLPRFPKVLDKKSLQDVFRQQLPGLQSRELLSVAPQFNFDIHFDSPVGFERRNSNLSCTGDKAGGGAKSPVASGSGVAE